MSSGTVARIGSALVDPRLSRRQLLLAGAGSLVLAACGKGGDDTANADASTTTTPGAAGGGLMLVPLFQPMQAVATDLRLPLALADGEGSFDVDLPRTAVAHLRRPDGSSLDPITLQRHDKGLPRGYFPMQTRFDAEGRWTIELDAGKTKVQATVDVRPASQVPVVPAAGDPLPKVATPTPAQHGGVNPICTAQPHCPFHDVSLDQAIGGDKPIVLLVSTPAFCQVAICGPVLDLLVSHKAQLDREGITAIHAEVYVDRQGKKTSPTVDALGLTYEPSLFLAAPDGTVTERLDLIFDAVELDDALSRLAP
jgi:hypothetical protein